MPDNKGQGQGAPSDGSDGKSSGADKSTHEGGTDRKSGSDKPGPAGGGDR